MAQPVSEVGRRVLKGTTAENTATVTPISIDTLKTLVLPAKPTTNPRGTGTKSIISGGALEATIVITGTASANWTTNGVTPVAATVGLTTATPGATLPVTMTLRGQDVIAAFQIIGNAAGSFITYQFYVSDLA